MTKVLRKAAWTALAVFSLVIGGSFMGIPVISITGADALPATCSFDEGYWTCTGDNGYCYFYADGGGKFCVKVTIIPV